jgi:hypothetical protein
MLNSSQRCAGILVLGSLLALWAAESSVRADPDETKNKPAVEADEFAPGKYRGLIVSAPNEGGLFRVAVEYPRIRIKPGREKDYERVQLAQVKQFGKAYGKAAQAEERRQLTPYNRQRRTYLIHGLPDRREISGALGMSADATAEFAGLNAVANGLLELVRDTQTVIFHAAPKVQVRVLQSSGNATIDTAPSDGKQSKTQQGKAPPSDGKQSKTQPEKAPLPGYEGALSDLKVGQRILLTLAPTKNIAKLGLKGIAPGSVYKRLVDLVIVEEEAQPGKEETPTKVETPTKNVDALQAGSRWRGKSRTPGGGEEVSLTVVRREGATFRAELEGHGPQQGLWALEGRVENGQINFRGTELKKPKGRASSVTAKGSISEKEISVDFDGVTWTKDRFHGSIALELVAEEKK